MGLLVKSVIFGAIAGSALVSARAVPVFLDWRRELAARSEVVAFARDVRAGAALQPEDLTTIRIASELAEGSALRRREACVGRRTRCSAGAGAVVVEGCLERSE